MTPSTTPRIGTLISPWDDVALAAALFAVDPAGTGGVALRALAGPVRDLSLIHISEPTRPY